METVKESFAEKSGLGKREDQKRVNGSGSASGCPACLFSCLHGEHGYGGLLREQPAGVLEDGLEEVSPQGVFAEELHRQIRRAEERAGDPGELGAKEEISRQLGDQQPHGDGAAAGEFAEELQEADIGDHARKGNQADL